MKIFLYFSYKNEWKEQNLYLLKVSKMIINLDLLKVSKIIINLDLLKVSKMTTNLDFSKVSKINILKVYLSLVASI